MGVYAELMANSTITVKSDDDNVLIRVRNRSELSMQFRSNSYRRYDEATLEQRLSTVFDRLAEGKRDARFRALAEALGTEPRFRRDYELETREREFRDLVAELTPRGRSTGDFVKITNTGLRDWRVRLKPGVLDRLGETELADEISSAYQRLLQDHRRLRAEVRLRVYGPTKAV